MTAHEYDEIFLKKVEESNELDELDQDKIIKKAIVYSLQYDPKKRYGFTQLHQLLSPFEDDAYLTYEQRINVF